MSISKTIWLPFYITVGILITWSSFSFTALDVYDEKRIIQAFLLVFQSCLFIYLILKNRISIFGQQIGTNLFWLWLTLLLLSSLLAPLSEWAFLQLGWYLLLGQLILVMAYLYISDREHFLHIFLTGTIILCAIYICRVYADYIIGIINEHWTIWPEQHKVKIMVGGENLYPSGFLNFANKRFLNHLHTWSLPILAFSYIYYREKLILGSKVLLLFFISSWWMLVLASDARGTMLSSFISVVFIIILFRRSAIDFVKVYGFTAIVGLLLYYFLFQLSQPEPSEVLTRYDDSGRFDVWIYSINLILENPIFGVGPMHFGYMGYESPMSAPHNIILQIASEWGVPAMLLFIGFSLYLFYQLVKVGIYDDSGHESSKQLNIALIASFAAAIVHSQFSGLINTPLSQLMGALVLGAVIGEYSINRNVDLFKNRSDKGLKLYLIILLLVGNLLFVGTKVVSDIPMLKERKEHFLKINNTNLLYPRFWNQGMIYQNNKIEFSRSDGETEKGAK